MNAADPKGTGPPGAHRSTRDLGRLRDDLQTWLAGQLPGDASPVVSELTGPPSVGQSSETLLFEAAWRERGVARVRRLVARVAPQQVDLPLFPSYDLAREYRVMRAAGELDGVPVPEAMWLETDVSHLGSPFFIMGHVPGEVPSDVVYLLDGWLAKAGPEQRKTLQDSTIDVLAGLHAAPDPGRHFAFLQFAEPGGSPLRRHVAHAWTWYQYARARCGDRFALIEQGFRWLDDHWPAREGGPVLLWGDARIGNVLYRDFRPAAILDWEMAAIGPRELDIAWLAGSHLVFTDLLAARGVTGMPGFLRLDDVVGRYAAVTGRAPQDLEFYLTYAALRWAIAFVLGNFRRVRFGELPMPDDRQDLVTNRATLSRLLAGGPW